MIRVVFVSNPFQPANGRELKISEAVGKPLVFYIGEYLEKVPGGKAWVQLNGRIIHDVSQQKETLGKIVSDGAFILVMPAVEKGGSKNPLALIASIAVSVISVGIGGFAATGVWGSFAGASAWTAAANYLLSASIMFLGGSLVSKLGPKVDVPQYQSEDPTYGWDGVQTMEGQGNGVAITYGTVKSGGQSIVKFVTNDEDDQYLNWLLAAGEGPLEISDILINNNPVNNYEGVTVDIRPGTNDQDLITNFDDTIQSKTLGYELDNDKWRTDIADGNSAEGLVIDIECSQGLYYANNDGGLSTAWVKVKAECAIDNDDVPDEDKDWTTITTGTVMLKNNPLEATLSGSPDVDKAGNYTVSVSIDNNRWEKDDDGNKKPNPTYKYYIINVTKEGNRWGYSKNFSPEESGSLTVNIFNFDKDILKAKGAGYSTTLEVYESGYISAAQTSAVRRQFRVDHLTPGKYKVRVTVIARSHGVDNTRAGVKTYWTALSTVVYDDFMYPNIALIGIKALATSQLSGSTPSLTFLKSRANVWVWNPHTNVYEEKESDNPAWAAYDFLHGCRQLKNIHSGEMVFDVRGVPAELMLYDQFEAWAENCERLNLKINIEVSTANDFWSTVNKEIAPVGRGKIIRFGTRFGCYYDHNSQPVQLFNMGNIKAGSFALQYLGTQDRANAVELSFNNAAKDYERDTITIYGDDYDTADMVQNPTQIQMNGITDYEQAYREGKYQLMCNKFILKTITFKADVDAISCMVGDQILVAHDVPQWALSGRVLRVDGNNTMVVPLDPEEITGADRWALQYRSSSTDKIYTHNVDNISGGWNEVFIHIEGMFAAADPPQVDDLFVLGKVDATSKPFIVTAITRDQDLVRNITAIEYAEGVFDENYDIPQPDYSISGEPEAKNVVNLAASQIAYKNPMGQYLCKMFLSWQLPSGAKADYFIVYLSDNGGRSYRLVQNTQTMELELDTQAFTEYYVKVVTVYKLKQSSGTVVGPVAAGIDVAPPDVDVLDYDVSNTGTRRFWWDFTYPNPNDIAGFELRYNQGTLITWGTAQKLHTGVVTQQPFETQALRQGVHTVMIKAVDNAGQYSSGIAYAVLDLGDPLEENVLYKVDVTVDNWEHTLNNGFIDSNGYMVSSSNVYFWTAAEDAFWLEEDAPFWTERYGAFEFSYMAEVPASGQFWLLYDISGPARVEYRVVGKNPFWCGGADDDFWHGIENWAFWVDETVLFKPYTGKVLVKAGDQVQIRVTAPDNVAEATIIKKMVFIVDVPDREEHFENITVPLAGLELAVKTPHYYTTAVRVDAVQGTEEVIVGRVEYTRNPCVIKLFDINNKPMTAVVDITWQGFVKEVI